MKNNLEITIGIPAFNEEKNIGNLLQSIFEQKLNDNTLSEILIFSDGSTDNTVAIAKSWKQGKINVYDDKKRKGQGFRMNQIMRQAKGDIIIFLDADVVLGSTNTLESLANGFKVNANIGLVGGNAIPFAGQTFTEKAVSLTTQAYEELKKTVRGGNNIFGVCGRVLAIRTDLAKLLSIPHTVFATDAFLYFSCLKKGYTFLYVKDAIVRYRSPSAIRDQIKQNTRFSASPYILNKVFGDIVEEEYKIPFILYSKAVIKHFFKHPIYSVYIFIINLYSKFIAKKETNMIGAAWQVSETTKEGIVNIV